MIHFWTDQSIPSKICFYSKVAGGRMSGCFICFHLTLNSIFICFVFEESDKKEVAHGLLENHFANGTGSNFFDFC
jgi:hypothetical protein